MAVDDMVGRLVQALAGEDTMFVYLSDNGLMNGAHRFVGKDLPYDRSTRVPMAISWPGHITPGVSQRITTNVDLTATILDAVGATLPGDGLSIFDGDRTETVLEQKDRPTTGENVAHPGYCGVRTQRYMFVEYDDDLGSELYDYQVDPAELTNLTDDPSYQDVRAQLRALAQQLCTPVPPGFNW
jgi:arylsulfatase A-like enzyme